MPQFAYASVGVSLKEFMAGKNPTTQPGVEVSYYTSMAAAMENAEFEFDGKNSASCIMMFDVDAIKTKLTSSPNPNILGRGTIAPQHIVDTMLQIKEPGKPEPLYINAGKCDWNQARATVQFMHEQQKEAQVLAKYQSFMKHALHYQEQNGVTEVARDVFHQYAGQQVSDAMAKHGPVFGDTPVHEGRIHSAMFEVFTKAYCDVPTLPEAQQIIAGLAAVNKMMERYHTPQTEKHDSPESELDLGRPSLLTDENGGIDPNIFYRDATYQRPDPSDTFSQKKANHYAALQFSFLPDNLRDIVTNDFNEKLFSIAMDNGNSRIFEAKDVMTAIAYAWNKEFDRIQQEAPAVLSAQASRFGRISLESAMWLGATAQEITKEPEIVSKYNTPIDTVPGDPGNQNAPGDLGDNEMEEPEEP